MNPVADDVLLVPSGVFYAVLPEVMAKYKYQKHGDILTYPNPTYCTTVQHPSEMTMSKIKAPQQTAFQGVL